MGNPVRVAIIGVGNCASSFVQGVEFYKNAKKSDFVPGLMHPVLGGYHIRDIEFVAAIDIDKNKVGKDLKKMGYTVEVVDDWMWEMGAIGAIIRDPNTGVLTGGADPRQENWAAGK